MWLRRLITPFICLGLAAGCDITPPEPGIGEPIEWSDLAGWNDDRQAESWPALLRSCSRLQAEADWTALCLAAGQIRPPTDRDAREFYETWFTAHGVYAEGGAREGLITGYYEPLLFGSREQTDRFRYPVYGRPRDLLVIELSDLYPELAGKRLRGRIHDGRVIPYHSRASLDTDPDLLKGHELLWVDDPIALFFLHIQGSGRVRLPDETLLRIGYADQNGHPYRSIGRELIDLGELDQEEVNLFSIRRWLEEHPDRVEGLFGRNPSYVFFSERPDAEEGPYGSMGVPLIAERSIAVDRTVIRLGLPVWLDTTLPDNGQPYRRLVLAQDTGGAIKGHVRADLFWGNGKRAERMAGLMKQKGRLYVLLPRARPGT